MLLRWLVVMSVSTLIATSPSAAQQGEGILWENPHRGYVTKYEGTSTCLGCHEEQGSIDDPTARIYPFKYHEAKLPIDNATKLMIPMAVGMVFKTGNSAAAVKAGAKNFFGREVTDVGWIETERYMGIFHEVVPKKDALACTACHGTGGRMNWTALGYKGDPMKTGARKVAARK